MNIIKVMLLSGLFFPYLVAMEKSDTNTKQLEVFDLSKINAVADQESICEKIFDGTITLQRLAKSPSLQEMVNWGYQDKKGNTIFHRMVLKNRLDLMTSEILKNRSMTELKIANKDNLTFAELLVLAGAHALALGKDTVPYENALSAYNEKCKADSQIKTA